ncbi:MAG: MBL fold metallo-hydrolase [Candidatus Aadella gelida]|nr:MBL fold metallo-hydrolase [Candidatus Aadella gelida]
MLFDTGENGKNLFQNMKNMDVDICDIKHVVISHDHWDHTGGLEAVLKKKKRIKVYGCGGFSREFKDIVSKKGAELMESELFDNITGNIFTTGSIEGTYKNGRIEEQSLVIKTANGMSIVTGCAHPGIVNIVERVKNLFPQEKFYCILGGFHLKDMRDDEIVGVCDRLTALGVQKAGPAHCSGENGIRIFSEIFKENFIQVVAGTEIEV